MAQLLRRRMPAMVAAGACAALALAGLGTGSASAAPAPVDLQILSFNDYHGTISATSNATVPGVTGNYGGAAYLTTTLQQLRQGKTNSLTVAAGDLIGASPVASGLFHDEPSIATLNAMGVNVSSVGNHEFDEGVTELLRMQYGGCHPVDGCYGPTVYPGAAFPYLAANVTYKDGVRVTKPRDARGDEAEGYGSWFQRRTGRTILPPTWISEVDDIKVGFIGMTLKGTNEMVAQAGIKNVDFRDEVTSANLAAADLAQRGVRAIVVLIHEGGLPPNGAAYNFTCTGATGAGAISGAIVKIAQGLDPKIDMVVSGHTHQAYACNIPDPAGQPRWVTSAYYYGRMVTNTTRKLDRVTKDVIRSSVAAVNVPVARTTADPTVASIVSGWEAKAAPLANRVIGSITADITRWPGLGGDDRSHESPLADMIADAQLDRTKVNGAQIAFMNSGGVRNDLVYAGSAAGEGDGKVTYGETFAVQPFGNTLTTITMTGQQIKDMLEQQWVAPGVRSRVALVHGVSRGFTYTYTLSNPLGSRVDAASMKLDGVPIDPAASYRVTVSNFLADGGDSFTVFTQGTNRVGGGVDLDELVAWFGQNSPVAPPAPRITANP